MEGPWEHPNSQKAAMEKYAYSGEVQVVLGRMLQALMLSQPSDPVSYMIDWLKAEENRRKNETGGTKTASEERAVVAE